LVLAAALFERRRSADVFESGGGGGSGGGGRSGGGGGGAYGTTARLLSLEQRERTADMLNTAILAELGLPLRPALETLLQQLLVTSEVVREANGGRGEPLVLAV